MKILMFMLALASENKENVDRIGANSKDDYTKDKSKTSNYIGVTYMKTLERWQAQRHSKNEYRMICNGPYKNEKTAACASDSLARKLMENGEHGHKLNFPDNNIEVYPEKEISSEYIGVTYRKKQERWRAERKSINEKKTIFYGYYKDEETAARASDTLARKLIANGGYRHKLNFPDDKTDVYPETKKTSSEYIGVTYNEKKERWQVQRWSKLDNKPIYNGCYKDEEKAASASDTLARKLIENGEHGHKLNFPDIEVHPEKKANSELRKDKRKRREKIDLSETEEKLF